ncbi:hypothetical protein D9M72_555440 [compost metagenome]
MNVRLATSRMVISSTSRAASSFWPTGRFSRRSRKGMVGFWSCSMNVRGRLTPPSVARQSTGLQVFDQAPVQPFQMRQRVAVACGNATGVAQQIADLGASAATDVLVHGRVVGGGGLDHPLHFRLQLQGCLWLPTVFE